jgi:hypothetical protein
VTDKVPKKVPIEKQISLNYLGAFLEDFGVFEVVRNEALDFFHALRVQARHAPTLYDVRGPVERRGLIAGDEERETGEG